MVTYPVFSVCKQYSVFPFLNKSLRKIYLAEFFSNNNLFWEIIRFLNYWCFPKFKEKLICR